MSITESVSQNDLDQVEVALDRIFSRVGIDIEFSRHFLQRVNDARNVKEITTSELIRIFKKTYRDFGKELAGKGDDFQAVLKDLGTNLNIPFVINVDRNGELELVSKTIMRKPNFKTSNPEYRVGEGMKLLTNKQKQAIKEADTFKCPDCGGKVLNDTKYCMKCKKKVKKESIYQSPSERDRVVINVRYNPNREILTVNEAYGKIKTARGEYAKHYYDLFMREFSHFLVDESISPSGVQNATFSGKAQSEIMTIILRNRKAFSEASKTAKCPDCGGKVLNDTKYCMKCKKKVKKESIKMEEYEFVKGMIVSTPKGQGTVQGVEGTAPPMVNVLMDDGKTLYFRQRQVKAVESVNPKQRDEGVLSPGDPIQFMNSDNKIATGKVVRYDQSNPASHIYLVDIGEKDSSLIPVSKVIEGYKVMPGIDNKKYQPRDGLEGPFTTRSGKVLYYDPREGSYYDSDSDMYVSDSEYQMYDESKDNIMVLKKDYIIEGTMVKAGTEIEIIPVKEKKLNEANNDLAMAVEETLEKMLEFGVEATYRDTGINIGMIIEAGIYSYFMKTQTTIAGTPEYIEVMEGIEAGLKQ